MNAQILMPKLKVAGVEQSQIIVLAFEGKLALSQLYEFNIDFVSKVSIQAQQVIHQKATLSFAKKGKGTTPLNGEVISFSQIDGIDKYYRYQIIIKPQVNRLCHTRRTEVYLDKTIPQIIKQILDDNGITQVELDLINDHKPKTFVFQHNEYDWDFISRWLAFEGLFYYFTQQESDEKLVITDSNTTLQINQDINDLHYQSYTSDSEPNPKAHLVYNFQFTTEALPKKLTVKSYYYEQSTKPYTSKEMIDENGVGEIIFWAENIKSDKENQSLAKLISESYQWKKEILSGISSGSLINPGTFINHKRFKISSLNKPMLIIESHYSGSQKKSFESGHSGESHAFDDHFKCEYKAIDKSRQYRTSIDDHIPRIDGMLPGFVDHEGDKETVQIDKKGLYKFRLAISDASPGKGSDWVRKMESYIGDQYAFSLPLHKGTELLLGFQFGNPDLPVLLGSLSNSTHRNMITSKSQQYLGLQTKENNTLIINEQEGKTRGIQLSTPNKNTTMVLGTDDVFESKLDAGFFLHTDSSAYQHFKKDHNTIINRDYRCLIEGEAGYYCQKNAQFQFEEDRITSVKGDDYHVTEKNVITEIKGNNALTVGGNYVTHVKGMTGYSNWGAASYDYLGLRTQSVFGLDFISRALASIDMTGGFNIKMTSGWRYEEDNAASLKTAPVIMLEALETISLTVGASMISMNAAGITISGPQLNIVGIAETTFASPVTNFASPEVNISGEVTLGPLVDLGISPGVPVAEGAGAAANVIEAEELVASDSAMAVVKASVLAAVAAAKSAVMPVTEALSEEVELATAALNKVSKVYSEAMEFKEEATKAVLTKVGGAYSEVEGFGGGFLGIASKTIQLPGMGLDYQGNWSFHGLLGSEKSASQAVDTKIGEQDSEQM